jgi:hypothetical protein
VFDSRVNKATLEYFGLTLPVTAQPGDRTDQPTLNLGKKS